MIIENFLDDMRDFSLVANTASVSGIWEVSKSNTTTTTIKWLLFRDNKGKDVMKTIKGQVSVVQTTHKLYCKADVSAQREWFITEWSAKYEIVDINPGYFFWELDHQTLYLVKLQ